MYNQINNQIIQETLEKAKKSPRKRAMYCFHKPEDRLQRMINACLKGTYVAPNKSENPGKLKIFTILKGKAALLYFDDSGKIKNCFILDEKGSVKSGEVPPGIWSSVIALADETVFYEIVDGKYDPNTHKTFAPWAPAETDKKGAEKYLEKLEKEIKPFI
jgi:cupin fold WbuC family metalloprotein